MSGFKGDDVSAVTGENEKSDNECGSGGEEEEENESENAESENEMISENAEKDEKKIKGRFLGVQREIQKQLGWESR